MQKALFCWLLWLPNLLQAQVISQPILTNYSQSVSRGTWLVGLQAGYSKGILLGNNLTTQAYGGVFVANKVLAGLAANWNQEGFRAIQDVSYSIGPMIRYHLTHSRLSPFIVASYQFGRHTVTGSVLGQTTVNGQIVMTSAISISGTGQPVNMYVRLLGAGVSWSLSSTLRIEAVLNWQDKVTDAGSDIHFDRGLFQPQVGINYLLKKAPLRL